MKYLFNDAAPEDDTLLAPFQLDDHQFDLVKECFARNGLDYDFGGVQATGKNLHFYMEGMLFMLKKGSVTDRYIVVGGIPRGVLFHLTACSVLHDIAERTEPLFHDARNITDYLQFYCALMSEEHGGDFYMLNGDDHVAGLPAGDKSIKNLGYDASGNHHCQGLMLFGDIVFDCKMTVSPRGVVSMTSERPVLATKLATATPSAA